MIVQQRMFSVNKRSSLGTTWAYYDALTPDDKVIKLQYSLYPAEKALAAIG